MAETRESGDALRIPPHDLQAEMGVLGSMLLSTDAIHLAREALTQDSFYKLAHQEVFAAVLELSDKHNAVDLVLLRNELQRRQRLEKAGGTEYLIELCEAVPTSANAEHYISIVHEHAVRRHLIATASEIQKRAYHQPENVADLLDRAEAQILAVRDRKGGSEARDVQSVLDNVLEQLELAHQHPGQITGLPSGYYDLDDLTGGFRAGEFVVLAARPSQGKTTLALNMLHNVCFVQRRPAALFSMEMPAEQIVSNFLCMHNRLDTKRFRSGNLEDREWTRLQESIDDLVGVPLYIDDTPALRLLDFRARARRLVQRHEVELIVIDYMQLMRTDRQLENRAVEVGLISAGLKALARECEVPVLAIAQLSRRVEQENRHPRMSDLRESGSIEQDADAILLLHRPTDPMAQGEGGENDGISVPAAGGADGTLADVLLAKQRNGPTGVAHMVFIGPYLRFESRASHAGAP